MKGTVANLAAHDQAVLSLAKRRANKRFEEEVNYWRRLDERRRAKQSLGLSSIRHSIPAELITAKVIETKLTGILKERK